ncbi:PREDICTED: uncharacterized protein LOC108564383 [Nicrophorus vespilloides]|uniref:Uncharacterized protein LOC108564383 n=1 Tax=Nicrophorus vespilloides TaxID=110193 RepID=A0ABM1MWF2_NICVS|nr:PREDICTED: uncharacterized protein LOC108564383 [Nicrophorus vespilloides]
MAPSPENDSTPKAPDKSGGSGSEPKLMKAETLSVPKTSSSTSSRNKRRGETTKVVAKTDSVTTLDDRQLKSLLEEAINYKTPRDRVGKSELFQILLSDAEDELRKSTAQSASGSENARYYSTTANQRNQRNKKNKSNSISENCTAGGSLNNLAKEELYQKNLQKYKKTVSARQKEGGSLPSNVNAGARTCDKQFLEELQTRKSTRKIQEEYTIIDMESTCLLENDSLGQDYDSCAPAEVPDAAPQSKSRRRVEIYTSRASLQINNVDEAVSFPAIEKKGMVPANAEESFKVLQQDKGQPYTLVPINSKWSQKNEEKKVDENGNALNQQTSALSATDGVKKRSKKVGKKAEDIRKAEEVEGHRGDIIHNIDMLVEYISGTDEKSKCASTNVMKSKINKSGVQQQQSSKPQRNTRTGKVSTVKEVPTIKKSTSMEEISITKLDDFTSKEVSATTESKIPLRPTKSNAEKPRDRKSWGTSLELYQNTSVENLESADFTFVTSKKKKGKKQRRNSLGSRKQVLGEGRSEFHRGAPGVSPHRKAACSVPHSEKSNDDSSSDVDSVHSLPVDGEELPLNMPVSYADIAKCAERSGTKMCNSNNKTKVEVDKKPEAAAVCVAAEAVCNSVPPVKEVVVISDDFPSLQNWPEIRANKLVTPVPPVVANCWPINNNSGMHSNNSKVNAVSIMDNGNMNNKINKSVNKPPPKKKTEDQQTSPTSLQHPHTQHHQQPQIPQQQHHNHPPHHHLQHHLHQKQHHQQQQQQHNAIFLSNKMITMKMIDMPLDIPDVQSIEKMQLKNLQQKKSCDEAAAASVEPMEKRPAVVILSGGDKKQVSDITFGFDINEQLLTSSGEADDVCSDFVSRFYLPESTPKIGHVDKLVHYIGSEWEDVLVQLNSGKVKYYAETYSELI